MIELPDDEHSLFHGDCLDIMPRLPSGCADMVLCDLPYGTTQNKWDSVIPFEPLWREWARLYRGAIVLFAAQPFTSALVMSNPRAFSYEWIWRKKYPVGHLNAKKRPMAAHESVLVFSGAATAYRAQGLVYAPRKVQRSKTEGNYGRAGTSNIAEYTNYPVSVLDYGDHPNNKKDHPTQKPVDLLSYLMRTYTDEGATVLDNTMGSGSTGVACENTGRRFIGIERDPTYFATAKRRMREAYDANA